MKKEKFLSKPITKSNAVFLYSSFVFLIIMIFLANFFMNSYATLLNYAWGGIKLSSATQRAGAEISEQIAAEGTVLLKNGNIDTSNNSITDKILPLKKGAKVTLLGKTSVDFIYGGTGSGKLDTRKVVDFKTALENKGIKVNPTVWNAYNSVVKEYPSSVPPIIGPGYFAVNEVPYERVAGAVASTRADYKDCAIVVLGRSGGEGQDLPNSYLYLTDVEKDLLKKACENFDSIVVLINANNTLQLRWLEDGKGKLVKENIDAGKFVNNAKIEAVQEILNENERAKIKGALWIGGVGVYGLNGVASVITGEENPSGRLPDTWAYDVMSAPANNYIGHANYNDSNNPMEMKTNYSIYHEGIYVGYRYYESRYFDLKSNKQYQAGNLDKIQGTTQSQTEWAYDDKELGVQYPFGYGLSYTTFEYELIDPNPTYSSTTQTVDVRIEVKNTGTVAGKTAVQLYVQIPQSTVNNVQKSAIQLVGFAKTGNIAPNSKEIVKISVDVKDLRYYDTSSNGSFKVETGEYNFTTGSKTQSTSSNKIQHNNNAHSAIDEILKTDNNTRNVKKLSLTDASSMQNRIANGQDGKNIQNKFTGNGSYGDIKTYDTAYKYASRSGTDGWKSFPINLSADSRTSQIKIGDIQDKDKLNKELTSSYARESLRTQVAGKNPDWTKQAAIFGAKTHATVLSLIGTAGYINTSRATKEQNLTTLAQQITYNEATRLVRMGGYATEQIVSIGLPKTEDKDGPSGFTDTFFNNAKTGTAFPAQIVIAATSNVEFAKRVGEQIAREAKEFKISGWYAPGLNLHRSALGGRNFEYYSEDTVLSSVLGTQTVRSAVEGGVIIYLKHIAMNDIETNRLGLGVWADEQTMREFYYAPFEDAIVEGKCNAVMTSFTRIGTRWTGHSYEFMTEILRKEWGFNGMAITDYAGNLAFQDYLDIEAGLLAGNNLWLNTVNTLYTEIEKPEKKNDAVFTHALQKATKNIIYTVGTSNAMQIDMGLVNHKTGKIIERMLGWQVTLLILTIVFVVFAAAGISYTTVRILQTKKAKSDR